MEEMVTKAMRDMMADLMKDIMADVMKEMMVDMMKGMMRDMFMEALRGVRGLRDETNAATAVSESVSEPEILDGDETSDDTLPCI